MAIVDYRVSDSDETDHDAGFHDDAPSADCWICRRVWCPLCTRRKKPAHQPLCFECATEHAEEAHQRGLIP